MPGIFPSTAAVPAEAGYGTVAAFAAVRGAAPAASFRARAAAARVSCGSIDRAPFLWLYPSLWPLVWPREPPPPLARAPPVPRCAAPAGSPRIPTTTDRLGPRRVAYGSHRLRALALRIRLHRQLAQ